MDPHPLRLLETAHPLRPSTLSEGPPTPRLTPCQRLLTTPIKKLGGPTQMSRSMRCVPRQDRPSSPSASEVKRPRRQQNAPEVLKVCPRDCFVISTTRNATANPRYGFGSNSEVN